MPAAELSRLRLQISQLILIFDQPEEFSRRLRDLLSSYGNHAYRAGQAVPPQPLLPTYRVPALVMRQLELSLGKTSQEKPQQALALVDYLWKDKYLEPRQLAASLLGALPVAEVGREVIEKLHTWGRPDENLRVFNMLMENATPRLRREAPEILIQLVVMWLEDHDPHQKAVGLRALVPLINDRSYENLPAVFRLLGPLAHSPHPALQTDLQVALQALIQRSPVETAFFLRQVLSLADTPNTTHLVRRCLPNFPPAQQASLRAALEAKAASS